MNEVHIYCEFCGANLVRENLNVLKSTQTSNQEESKLLRDILQEDMKEFREHGEKELESQIIVTALANKKNSDNYTFFFAEQDTSSIRKEILGKGFKKKRQKIKIRIVYDDKYKENIVKNIKIICSNLTVPDNLKLDVQWEAWELYSYATEQKLLKPRDLGRFKNPRDFSVILVFYALKSLGINSIDNVKVTAKSIFRFLRYNFKKLELSKKSCRYFIPREFIPFLPKTLIKDKREKKQIYKPHQNSVSVSDETYEKSRPIWKFIYNYININFKELLNLRNKFSNDNEFFNYLSELLLSQLSKKTSLLIGLDSDIKKTLPKGLIAIYLLCLHRIALITGEELEEKSGMIGQHKKLRIISDHLGLTLPVLLAEELENLLDLRKKDILNGRLYPSPANLIKIDSRLEPLLKHGRLTGIVRRWLINHSKYNTLTELKKEKYYSSSIPSNKFSTKSKIPSKATKRALIDKNLLISVCNEIIENRPDIDSIASVNRAIGFRVSNILHEVSKTMKYDSFLKLQELYGSPIPHRVLSKSYLSEKWSFLYQDSEGNPLTDNEAKAAAADYFMENVLEYDSSKYNIEYVRDILKRGDFIQAIYKRGINYNDLLEESGLDFNLIPNRWEKLNHSLSGIPRSYDSALSNAAEHLHKIIFENDYILELNKAPSSGFMRVHHNDFMRAISNHGFRYTDIVIEAGLQPNRVWDKWKFLDMDNNGNLYSYDQMFQVSCNFFRDRILPIFYKNNLIRGRLAPTFDEAAVSLRDTEYNGFFYSSRNRGVPYGDILKYISLIPRDFSVTKKIGVAFHWIIEYIFMSHTRSRSKNCLSFYEALLDSNSLSRPDNTIIVNDEFRRLSEHARKIPKHIEVIYIDYYLSYSIRKNKVKIERGYQSNNAILILVPLNIKSNKLVSTKNVRVLCPKNFCQFFGFSTEDLKKFMEIVDLALNSIRDAILRDKLFELSEDYKRKIELNYPSQKFSSGNFRRIFYDF